MKPLAGMSILVTRPKEQATSAVVAFQNLGATVFTLPVIEIKPLAVTAKLDNALKNLESYDWVIFTSVNGVKAVEARLDALGIPRSRLSDRNLAAIGPATAAELSRIAREPDLVPKEYVSEAIAEGIAEPGGKRFLLARADIARKDLAAILRDLGGQVDEVAAYHIVQGQGPANLPEIAPDYITLTSSSAARGTYEVLRDSGREDWMARSSIVCIGPITSATVRELGFEVAAEAEEFTVPGVVAAVQNHAQHVQEPNHA